MAWNPEQYELFKQERFAPFDDLINLIDPSGIRSIVDLGCGTGELSARLAEIFESATVLGIDNSAEMLSKTEQFQRANLEFQTADIGNFSGKYDLVFSHAAIQWLPDHAHLLPQLWHLVSPGGQIAIQMPANHTHLTHRLIAEVAAESSFVDSLDGWIRISPVLTIDNYADLLYQLRAENISVLEKVYPHVLLDVEALVNWVKGTALVPYLEKLTPAEQDLFLETYTKRLAQDFPDSPIFYGFRRILLHAKKPHVN